MNTFLDGTAAWLWFPESAEYKDRELRLVLAEGTMSNEKVELEVLPGAKFEDLKAVTVPANPKLAMILFQDVRLLYIIDELAHKIQSGESRDNGIVARHHNSALLRWVAESTKLIEQIPGELLHFSVETAEDFYHVLTRARPKVSEVEA